MKRNFAIVHLVCLLVAVVMFAISGTRDFARSFFFNCGRDYFADFLNCVNSLSLLKGGGFDPYHNWLIAASEQIYPPFAYVLLLPFVRFLPETGMSISGCHASMQCNLVGVLGVGVMAIVFFSALCLLCRRVGLPRWMAFVFSAAGQSLWCYERGNMILIAASGIILFLCGFQDERPRIKILAAMGLSVAVALKVTPVLFGLVWLNKKDLRWLFLAGVLTLTMTITPLLWSSYSISESILQLLSNVDEHERIYELGSMTVNPSCVLRMFIGQALGLDTSKPLITTIVYFAKLACVTLGMSGLLMAAYFKMPRWQQFILLASGQILIPTAPQQYVFLFMFPALAVLLSAQESSAVFYFSKLKSITLQRVSLFVLFIVLMIPIPIFVFRGCNVSFAIQSILISSLVSYIVVRKLTGYAVSFLSSAGLRL